MNNLSEWSPYYGDGISSTLELLKAHIISLLP